MEYQSEMDINLYDFGARNYDPALGRWMNIDPLSEEYFNLTPYNYVANIPTIFIDPDGMKIVDPDEIVKDHKENIQNTIKELQKMVKNGSMSEDIGNMLINVSENALSEINSLEKSSQVYNVFTDTSIVANEGGTYYDYDSKQVMIGIGSALQSGVIGHELKHGHQFEEGNISFVTDNSTYGRLYDLGDEKDAYNIQFMIENGEFSKNYLLSTNSEVIQKYPIYKSLPSKNLNLRTKTGKSLRKEVIEAGKNGTIPKEIYIHWEKDYQKGVKMRNK